MRTTAIRAGRALATVPLVYVVGISVAVPALIPVLAVYGVAVTALQAAGWALVGDPVLSTGVVDAGLFFLVLPAAASVGVGAVGFATPAAARGVAPTTALRRGLGRFLDRPGRWVGHGAVVVGLLLAPLGVLIAGQFLGAIRGRAYEVTVGTAGLVAVACYALGPVYRAAAPDPTLRSVAGGDRASTGSLPTRQVVAVLVVSSVVLAGVGAVRVADVRPAGPAPAQPEGGVDGSPTEIVGQSASWLAAIDHETRRSGYVARNPNESDRAWRLLRRERLLFDVDDRRFAWVSVGRGDGERELDGTVGYVDRGVELRRRTSGTGTLSKQRLDVRVGVDDSAGDRGQGLARWRLGRSAHDRGLFEEGAIDVPAATRVVRDLAAASPGTFRRVQASVDRVVFETVDATAYCQVRGLSCADSPITGGRIRVVLDADTGAPVAATEYWTRRRSDPDPGETRTVRRRMEFRFDVRDVAVTRPADADRRWVELLADAIVY